MSLKETLNKLATSKQNPSITISINLTDVQPGAKLDLINLKNLTKQAEQRLAELVDKDKAISLLNKLETLLAETTIREGSKSLHLFVNEEIQEAIFSIWIVEKEGTFIDDTFAVRPIIKDYNRTQEYYILTLTQKEVRLFVAINDTITEEIKNDDFPFNEDRYKLTHLEKRSDGGKTENLVKEYFNLVDKAIHRVLQGDNLKVAVVSTDENYSVLLQVADQPSIYIGNKSIDFNQSNYKNIAQAAYEVLKVEQHKNRTTAIESLKESISSGNLVTDINEIYQAAIDGRADILAIHHQFSQPAILHDRTLELVEDPLGPDTIDDITSIIAWEVINKGGQAFFTQSEEIAQLGNIALKTRY